MVKIPKRCVYGLELCLVHLQVLIDATKAQGLEGGTKWGRNHGGGVEGLERHTTLRSFSDAVAYHHQRCLLWGQAAPSLEERMVRHQCHVSATRKEPLECLLTIMEEVSLVARQLSF